MRKGNFFRELLKRSLITLIVPLLTMVLIYAQADRVLKEQILLSHEAMFDQCFGQMEAGVEVAELSIFEIALSDECRSYGYAETTMVPAYHRIQIRTFLNDFVNETIATVMVYYPEENRLIATGGGATDPETFVRVYYPDVEVAEFQRILSMEATRATLCVMENLDGTGNLCMVLQGSIMGREHKNFKVVLVFAKTLIPALVQSQIDEAGGTILIFDGDKELLKSEDGKDGYHLEDYTGQRVPFETRVNGARYMMQVKKAESFDGYYAYVIPEDYFWAALEEVCTLCFCIGFACVVISLVVAYRGSKRSYAPLENMLTSVKTYSEQSFDPKKHSEFEFFEDVLKQSISEKYDLSRELRKNAESRTERFLISLIGEHVEYDGKGDSIFEEKGIRLCSNRFMVALLCVEESLRMKADLTAFVINNVLSEMLQEKCISYFVRMNAKRCMVLVNLKENVEFADCATVFAEGRDYLQNTGKITLTAALGRIHEDIEGIQRSYSEAEQAEKYKFLVGLGQCISYTDIADRKYKSPQTVESKLLKLVGAFIKERPENKTTIEFVNEILEMYEISDLSAIETVVSFRYELFGVLHRASLANSKSVESSGEMLQELMRQPTLKQFCEKTVEYLNFLQQCESGNEEADACIRCREYIETHYRDTQLSVTEIGTAIGKYPSYLSKLFRAQYGVSIPEYIHLTRIKHCKQELRETGKSIAEIAEENGFLSSNVFVRTFKKYEGITPGMYRELP